MVDQPQIAQKPANPLMERVRLPGETFTLPSGGVFYDDSVITGKTAEIHVHPMTAIDEIVMKTPDLLFSGNAVKQIFGRCIPQVLDTDKLLAKDVDYLLTCLRKISYGDEMQIEYSHDCENAKNHMYTIDITKFVREAKRIDPTSITSNFSVKLPNDQVVNIRPICFGDFTKIMQNINDETVEDLTPEYIEHNMLSSITDVIVDVDGITDRDMIVEWLQSVPPMYLSAINRKLDETSKWGPDFDVTVVCQDCGEETTFTAPLNPLAFFT